MSYDYATERANLFNEHGVEMLIKIRDNVRSLLKSAGAVRMDAAIRNCGGGSSWTMLAGVDYLVETGELVEVKYGDCAGQHRVFMAANDCRL